MGVDPFESPELEVPPIYVSRPGFDDMGTILDQIGISYKPLKEADLQHLETGVVMLNCHYSWSVSKINPFGSKLDIIDDFVRSGGSLIASDYAGAFLESATDGTFRKTNSSTTTQAKVVSGELADLLGRERWT